MGWGTSWNKPENSQAWKDKVNKAYEEAASVTEAAWNNLKERQNKIPTHDPYTNPNAFIYYQCDCGQVLDPKTKSFASLNNHASNEGWKIRWGERHYVPYCPKCVKEKEVE